jgi:hypothetical protein
MGFESHCEKKKGGFDKISWQALVKMEKTHSFEILGAAAEETLPKQTF